MGLIYWLLAGRIRLFGVSNKAFGVRTSKGFFVGGGVHTGTSYALDCTAIQARISPTCQAVTLALSLRGLGKLPIFTMRHNVGAENGSGAIAESGLFGLRTSCA